MPVYLRDRSAQTIVRSATQRHNLQITGQAFHLTQSQYIDTGPTSPSPDLTTPGRFKVTGIPRPRKILMQVSLNPRSATLESVEVTTLPSNLHQPAAVTTQFEQHHFICTTAEAKTSFCNHHFANLERCHFIHIQA